MCNLRNVHAHGSGESLCKLPSTKFGDDSELSVWKVLKTFLKGNADNYLRAFSKFAGNNCQSCSDDSFGSEAVVLQTFHLSIFKLYVILKIKYWNIC